MNELFKRTGCLAMGSRLRLITDAITSDASKIYDLYGVALRPKWFPVFFLLQDGCELGITEIAKMIGQTHPSVIKIVGEMTKAGLTKTSTDPNDKRRTLISLTSKGQKMLTNFKVQAHDVYKAVEEIDKQSKYSLWEAIGEWERLLGEKSLLDRVIEQKVKRTNDDLQIVDYDDARHHEAFKQLNVRWISEMWEVEKEDLNEIDHPMENIISKGGFILMAELKGVPVGCFAMMPCDNPKYDWELVKYAVDPSAQGHGVGHRLMEACLERARQMGIYTLFLESNKKCEAAVHLYEKYGFKHLKVENSPFARCDVQMVRHEYDEVG